MITTVCGLLVLSIGGVGWYQNHLSWTLVAAVFLITFLNYNIHYPSLYAFVQEISEPRLYGKLSSYIEIQGQTTTMFAGALGALLLEGNTSSTTGWLSTVLPIFEAWDIWEIFLLDGLTYFVAFLVILPIRYIPLTIRSYTRDRLINELKIGWDFLSQNKALFVFGVASYSVFVGALIASFYLDAFYVERILQRSGNVFAISQIYYGAGALVAGISIRYIFAGMTIPKSIIIMTLVTAMIFFVLFVNTAVWPFYILILIFGLTNAGTRVQRVTFLFKNIPNAVYGRTVSIFFLSNITFRIIFLGLFSLAFFNTGTNIKYAFLMFGGFLVLSAMALMMNYTELKRNAQVE